MPLFRPEALRGQDTLHGEVSLVPPVGWQLLGGFLLASLAAAAVFLALAGYAQVAVVAGVVAGDKGVIRVRPPRAGVFDQVLVQEGQEVRAGAPLAHVTLETSDQAASLEQQRAEAIAVQRATLAERLLELHRGTDERIASLQADMAGQQRQVDGYRAQVDEERRLLTAAEEDLAGVRTIADQGYLTRHDLRQREEAVATRKQALSRLAQQIDQCLTALDVDRATIGRVRAETAGQAGELAAGRAQLDRDLLGEDVQRGVVLRAPVDGVVTAITAHPGDPASPGGSAMTLLPRGTRIEAVLSAPAAAAGFLEPGQSVRVAVDAFPFQTYGALPGVVRSISRTTTPVAGRSDGAEAFLVHAAVPAAVLAYGVARPLRPGMTVTARIRTRPRTLLAWLFDPLLAVRRR